MKISRICVPTELRARAILFTSTVLPRQSAANLHLKKSLESWPKLSRREVIPLEGTLKDRGIEEVIESVKSSTESLKFAPPSMKRRLSKIEATDDPSDGADDEYRRQICRWTA
jgi:hypothetical protein